MDFAIAQPIPVNLPAADAACDHHQQDENRHHREPGIAAGHTVGVERSLMSNDARVGWSFAGRFHIRGYRFVFVDAHALGVGAHVRLVEDAAGQQVKLLVFQGAQQARANLGGGHDLIERDATHLPFPTQTFAKCAHRALLRSQNTPLKFTQIASRTGVQKKSRQRPSNLKVRCNKVCIRARPLVVP